MDWQPIETAPRDGAPIILDLGESIPNTPIVSTGSFLSETAGRQLGEELSASGGWIVWNTDSDWYVISFHDAFGWVPLPHNKDSQE